MMFKYNVRYMVLCVALCVIVSATAQNNEKNFLLGFSSQVNYNLISHAGPTSSVDIYNDVPLSIGLTAQYKNIETDIQFAPDQFFFNARYTYKNHWFIEANLGLMGAYLGEEMSGAYYYSVYSQSISMYSYGLKVGYRTVFLDRISFKIAPSIASISSEKCDFNTPSYQNSATPAQLNTSYQLKPTMVFGGSIRVDLLPNPEKNRNFPFVPYFAVNIMGNSASNYAVTRSVDEWVPGNTVYYEAFNNNNYKYRLNLANISVGARIYFGNVHKLKLK